MLSGTRKTTSFRSLKCKLPGVNKKLPVRNQLLNIGWTIIGFLPVGIFWFHIGSGVPFYLSLLLGFVAGCLPELIYTRLHISNDFKKFEVLGIKSIRRFTQHGDFNRSRANGIKSYLKKLSMFERFHYICLVFFLTSSIYAFLNHKIILALLIFISNLVYNVCPILLQQYNRLRLLKVLKLLS
jgi:hypothetical protein